MGPYSCPVVYPVVIIPVFSLRQSTLKYTHGKSYGSPPIRLFAIVNFGLKSSYIFKMIYQTFLNNTNVYYPPYYPRLLLQENGEDSPTPVAAILDTDTTTQLAI